MDAKLSRTGQLGTSFWLKWDSRLTLPLDPIGGEQQH